MTAVDSGGTDVSPLLLPFADHDAWYWDSIRVVTIAGALLLIVVCVRLAWQRWQRPHPGEVFTHPLVLVSYALLLADITIRRLDYIDKHRAPDIFLVISFVAVALGVYGTVARTRLKPGNTITNQEAGHKIAERTRRYRKQQRAR